MAGLAYGLGLVVVARHVDPGRFGSVVIGSTLALILRDVVDLGRSNALTRLQAAGAVHTQPLARALVATKVRWAPVLLLPLACSQLVVSGTVRPDVVLFALYGLLSGLNQTLLVPALSDGRLGLVAGTALQEKAVAALVMVLLVGPLGGASLPVGLCVGAASLCSRLGRLPWSSSGIPMTPAELLRFARPFAVTSLASDVQPMDAPIVGALITSTAAGHLAAASRLMSPLTMPVAQLSQLVFVWAAKGDEAFGPRQAARLITIGAALYAGVVAALFCAAPWLLITLFGPSYVASATPLRWLLLGALLTSMTSPFGAWLSARRHARQVASTNTVATVVYFGTVVAGAVRGSIVVVSTAFLMCQLTTLLGFVRATRTRPATAGPMPVLPAQRDVTEGRKGSRQQCDGTAEFR
jgi:O-antigen/teichoic acid export membrane protein